MVLSYLDYLSTKILLLASSSPRRYELLTSRMNLKNIVIQSSDFKEDLKKENYSYRSYVENTALCKGVDVLNIVNTKKEKVDILLSFDTIVVNDNIILEKPKSSQDAINTLLSLSNKTHICITACTIIVPSLDIQHTWSVETKVKFGEINRKDIEYYVATNDPLDKAGSYGIQGLASTFIESIDGCYYNVMGLPVYSVAKELARVCNLMQIKEQEQNKSN